jgi:4-diphosphocytidyl-2-C-methyl-D-erythritol kinase
LFTVPAFAKINWNLRVLGKRATDGYHEICTTFQTVSLIDKLTFESATDLTLACNYQNIPTDSRNLIVRAANALKQNFDIKRGANIYLEKRIPSPGGLGGGSADAAITLIALSYLWELNVSRRELVEIARQIGADVPFFLFGGTALGTGIGTEIETLADFPKKRLLIVTPFENVSTIDAYKALNAPSLTEANQSGILTICPAALKTDNPDFTDFKNDFETVIFELKPEIARAKNKLFEAGASMALMSGSGASVFAVFEDETKRRAAFKHFRETEKRWRTYACETVSRINYQKALAPCWRILRN